MPGGQVEEGEDLIAGLEREVLEESGIRIEVGPLVAICSNVRPPAKVIFDFLGQHRSGSLTPSQESPELGWYSSGAALRMISHPAIHDRMETMLAFSGTVTYRSYELNPYVVHRESCLGP